MMRFIAALLIVFGLASAAQAAERMAFTPESFSAAQASGKNILVDVTASWCPICAKQHPIINSLLDTPELKDLTVLEVDFDTQKDVLRSLGVQMQSTLIVYTGKSEKGRSTGVTDPDDIKALLLKVKSS